MEIRQFYDTALSHASYAIMSNGEIALVDPARDPLPYFEFAREKNSKIVAIIETHPHADFVSSHKEIGKKTGANIYVSKLLGAEYPHKPFDSGDILSLGNIKLRALNTPGHSPDSICVVATDEHGKDHAVFTGDTLFIGDVGRPDLRENTGNIMAKREQLARDMFRSTRNILMKLEKDILIYPAHGAGSLCGKSLSNELSGTLETQLKENYALADMTENEFVDVLLHDQPFIPKYFGFDVGVNKTGAEEFEKNIGNVKRLNTRDRLDSSVITIDTRSKNSYNRGHVKGAINIIEDGKFETWLGSIVGPDEPFYLISENEQSLDSVTRRAAKIGYEKNILGALMNPDSGTSVTNELDFNDFRNNPENYTIVDVRNKSETISNPIFRQAINIPLYELRERTDEIPAGKPIVVFCAGGYRSAAASSIIRRQLPGVTSYDLGEKIREFKKSIKSTLE